MLSTYMQHPCLLNETHPRIRYDDASAVWVLICAIIVFFMVYLYNDYLRT